MTTRQKAVNRVARARRRGKQALAKARVAGKQIEKAMKRRKISGKALAAAATGLAVAAVVANRIRKAR